MTQKVKVPHLVLNDALAKVLINGVQTTLSTMFEVIATPKPYRFEKEPMVVSDISGIVGMAQEKSEAILIISFKKEAIFYVLGRMYKRKFTELDRTVRDGVGEIANIVYGILKKDLNDRGFTFKQVIPAVVVGQEHSISKMSVENSLVIPFETEAGVFHVELAIQP